MVKTVVSEPGKKLENIETAGVLDLAVGVAAGDDKDETEAEAEVEVLSFDRSDFVVAEEGGGDDGGDGGGDDDDDDGNGEAAETGVIVEIVTVTVS